MASILYYSAIEKMLAGQIDFEGDDLKCALLKSTHSPSEADEFWADVSADEVSGTGYTAGGFSLTGKTLAVDENTVVFDAADYLYGALAAGAAFRYGVIYDNDFANKDLIVCIDFGASNPAPTGSAYAIKWNTQGIIAFGNYS